MHLSCADTEKFSGGGGGGGREGEGCPSDIISLPGGWGLHGLKHIFGNFTTSYLMYICET